MAWLIVRRRLPWTVGILAVLVSVPWFAFATWFYGSPGPNSFVAKVNEGAGMAFSHRRWVLDFFLEEHRYVWLLAGCLVLGWWRRFEPRERLSICVLVLWVAFHASALSTLNLGAPYPWYLTVLMPGPIILVSTLAGLARNAPAQHPVLGRVYRSCAGLLLVVVFADPVLSGYRDARAGNPIKHWEAFDNDRRMAGIFLSQFAGRDEITESGFGWVAFEARSPLNDKSLLNSKIMRQLDTSVGSARAAAVSRDANTAHGCSRLTAVH